MKYGMGKKFVATVSIVFLISFVVFAYLVIDNVRKKLDQDIENNLIEISTQGAEVIKNKIAIYENNVELLSNISQIKDENIEIKDKVNLLNEVSKNNGFIQMGIVDLSGKGYTSLGESIDISKGEYFQKTIRERANATDVVTNKEKNTTSVIHTSPIIVNESIVGIVFAQSSILEFEKNIFPYMFKGNGNLYILDNELNVLLTTSPIEYKKYHKRYRIEKNIKKVEDDLKIRKVGTEKLKTDDFTVYVGYSPIDIPSKWTLISVVDEGVASQSTVEVIYYTIEVAILLGIIFTIIIVIIFRIKKKSDEEIDYLAFVDDVTGVRNYSKFIMDANKILESKKNKNYAIVYFDIDYFQIVNETFGDSFSDIVLWEIAQILKDVLPKDAIYTRYYKDNFVYLTSYENDKLEIIELVEKVASSIAKIRIGNKEGMHISVVSGIYYEHGEDISISSKVNKADLARIAIKGNKSVKYNIFSEEIRERQVEEVNLIEEIKIAAENNKFEVYYQPKIDAKSEKIVGCEALIRWKSKDGKFISPSYFIPIAEKSGLIEQIDRLVFRKVCSDIKEWKENNIHVYPISINLSRSNLYRVDLIESMQQYLQEFGVEASLLEIEITETTTISDIEFIANKISQIKNLGMKVSMDDFGVGDSSLSNLSTLPIDTIKLDKSFIADIDDNTKNKNIIKGIVYLAKSLNLNIVAEGVETKAQCDYLKYLGCDIIQGYYYARPMDKESLYKNFLT